MTRILGAAIACAAITLAVGCDGRPRATTSGASSASKARSGPAVIVFDLTGGIPEKPSASFLGVSQTKRSFDELVTAFDELKKTKDFTALLVRFGGMQMGFARAEELGVMLDGVRKSGKAIYCQADAYTNATLFAAARGCTKLYLSPAGEVEAIGVAAQLIYMHKLLAEHLQVSVDILQVGKFKGAEEPLTRDGPSDEARASLEGVLADIRASWLGGIKDGRGAASEAAEDGPFSPKKAKERGLVDEVGYADDALDALKKASNAVREEVHFGRGSEDKHDDLGDVLRVLAGPGGIGAPVALVRATGSIAMSSGGGLFGGSGGITERDLGRTLRKIEQDDDVKVVVLRIDSPGGSALASDLLWHQLMKVRAKKPIVVSVGEMAASGGYYLASTGSLIFADKTSIVGSIGVVGGKVAFGQTLEKIGVHTETFSGRPGNAQAANRAAYLSPLVAWDEPTKVRVLETMTGIYELFLSRLSEGRSTMGRTMGVEKIAPSAEGRIFSGQQGKERGLVDELGGLREAIARAKELAKLPPDAEVAVVGNKPGFIDALEGSGGGSQDSEGRAPDMRAFAGPRPIELLERVAPDLVPFATSMAPLEDGEHALCAIPFGLVIR